MEPYKPDLSPPGADVDQAEAEAALAEAHSAFAALRALPLEEALDQAQARLEGPLARLRGAVSRV